MGIPMSESSDGASPDVDVVVVGAGMAGGISAQLAVCGWSAGAEVRVEMAAALRGFFGPTPSA